MRPGDDEASPTPARAYPAAAGTAELSGIYFGILNIYTTLPQFAGTFIASLVFAAVEPGKGSELEAAAAAAANGGRPNAIAVCLFIGAMSAVVAAFATLRIKRL